MKYIKLFEKYNLNGRIYCICNLSKNDSFTIDKYYDLYVQNSRSNWSENIIKFKVKDSQNNFYELQIVDEFDKKNLASVNFDGNSINDIDEDIITYWMYFKPILFIKEEDVEKYELNRAIKNYNL